MTRMAIFVGTLLMCVATTAEDHPKRPRILGISSVRILAKNTSDSHNYYSKILSNDIPCVWCGQRSRGTFSVNETQYVQLAQSPDPAPANFIDEIMFATDDVPALRRYLTAHKVVVSTPIAGLDDNPVRRQNVEGLKRPSGLPKGPDVYLTVLDPEGHRIGFVQLPREAFQTPAGHREFRLIHAGFVVSDRAAEDRFYKEILGFRVYWHGGMTDDETNWVDMQVPDGTDWLEYMLNVPPDADHHTLGVMNHIALGVPDIEAAAFTARKAGILVKEDPKIGRDGKWQLNLYDPDDTRVEFMEFTPVQKACCSEYTGPHPGEHR
jgi:catechol 2,3-dioxygenase-like lactoylglutathione lyase family enzyme